MWRRAARCTPCGGCFGNDLPVLLLAPLENRYRLAQGLQFLAGLGLGVGSVIAGATLLQEVGKLRGGTLMLAFQRRQLTILARQLAFEGLDPLQCLLQYLVLLRLALAHNCGRGLAARHSIRWVIIGRVFTHLRVWSVSQRVWSQRGALLAHYCARFPTGGKSRKKTTQKIPAEK